MQHKQQKEAGKNTYSLETWEKQVSTRTKNDAGLKAHHKEFQ